ncbi:cupin domain-containing protein [Rufibacter radiotolerans]|uniref:cupin domain-containing protein n=1 Tax=Rufibacter radiotolerans TaxID=1379910 RepID=UPI0006645335|nr:cupin domain-containing protein [Rufibacter radiotolerans]
MSTIYNFIESGILELYVMGITSPQETQEVEQMAAAHPEVKAEIDQISRAVEAYAQEHAIAPRETVKPLVLATIDYLQRLAKGEPAVDPPMLAKNSKLETYAPWLNRADLTLSEEEEEDIFVKIIGHTPKTTTAIVWIKDMSDYEVHHDEYERFLIVEGTCDMIAGEHLYKLKPGDFFEVPLHTQHMIKVTSKVPCKAVLQRVAV